MQQTNRRSGWKTTFMAFCALIGGFLLSFLALVALWSGIPWVVQIAMFLPFLLFSYTVFKWTNESWIICALILAGATPLGILMMQFHDTNGSYLLPTLMVMSWIIGISAGCYLGKLRGAEVMPRGD